MLGWWTCRIEPDESVLLLELGRLTWAAVRLALLEESKRIAGDGPAPLLAHERTAAGHGVDQSLIP